ncbi:ATP-dependent nuclease [Francisella philomiragia]|uniref:AAA family ATPase n=1 Tax=Francisella philomiragia TaxID=28110 RepID=A0ABS1GB01_9GAMM|nr:AAA family ATPase [Francisella philomiragia]MBK2093965.1 AAA family ATPase [Francisella philomiragia]MBK2256435.1 AAA family ATPase [Francisella philomiragia]MBK2258207.1 AAA family ATPase [Francisella philomiragia]MBK2269093.1 AAA family ATPase [Francisella philomiragia]MBK2270433.1 AAA family ATPase [Francisella philomiragia]
MKITEINIKKFRSIENCTLQLNNINAIVGQNNSGKSAVIRALNSFFNPDEEELNYIQGRHTYTNKSTPRITITFSSISEIFTQYEEEGFLCVQQIYSSSSRKLSYKYKNNKKFISAPTDLIQKIRNCIAFIYIPPNRNPDDLRWEENTLIKKLVEESLKRETENRDTLTPKFRAASNYLENGALKKIAKSVESYYSLQHTFNFNIKFDQTNNFMSFLNGIEMKIHEHGVEHSLDDCGTGLQSLTIIALHRVLAKMRHQNIILGLEEPETNLHPQAQRELINSITNSHKKDVAQVILTTHSTVLIDNVDHRNIALVRKISDDSRGFKSKILKIDSSFFDVNKIDNFRYDQFHKYRNSDFFYANYVIFAESKNDAEVIKLLAKKQRVDLDLCGVSIVSIDGVKNLPYLFHIVKELELPYLVILDKDYFVPYLNDEAKESRDSRGFPKYRYEYKKEIILEELIPSKQDRDNILEMIKANHSRALDIFEKNNIVCMNYSLEIDLLCSKEAINKMSILLELSETESNSKFLLEKRNRAIKKLDNMLYVLDRLSNQNLPNSYKRIKKILSKI